jgi:WhiB family redox-sensing transcriptional regulator
MNMPGWSAKAACLEADPELFFPNGEGKSSWPQIAEAKAVCAACPVRGYCLDFALRTDAQYGIWAGTTPRDRQSIRRAGNYCGRQCGRAARPTWQHEIEIGIARHPDHGSEKIDDELAGECGAIHGDGRHC